MALFRAIETARPCDQRLFDDPMAAGFLQPPLKLALRLACLPVIGKGIIRFMDRRWPGARATGVARTRLIDDLMVEALQQAFEQVVILGAGFDARPYRLPHPKTLRFFEVDQPNTSQAKRHLIRDRLGELPSEVVYIEVDFNRQDLGSALSGAGFRLNQPAFFLWEGVSAYLRESAVDSTLQWIGSSAPASQVVFTYLDKRVLANPELFRGMEQTGRTLARSDERWMFGLDPAELRGYLAARGLELMNDFGATEIRARYLGDPGIGYEFYHVANARVMGLERV